MLQVQELKVSEFYCRRETCFFLHFHILKRSLDLMESAEVMGAQKDRVRVKRKTLEAVLQQCHLALQQLASGCDDDDDDDSDTIDGEQEVSLESAETSAPTNYDTDTTKVEILLSASIVLLFLCQYLWSLSAVCKCYSYTHTYSRDLIQ